MPQEIELKLAVDPRDVLRLRDSPILRAPSLKHTARQRLVSTYYDSPSFSLQRSGIILRVYSAWGLTFDRRPSRTPVYAQLVSTN